MVDNRKEEWPYGFDESMTAEDVTKEMVMRLVRSKSELDALTEAEQKGIEALGEELHDARNLLGITRNELARRTGLNSAFIPLIEAGRVTMRNITNTQVLDVLATALSLSKNELLMDSLCRYTDYLLD